ALPPPAQVVEHEQIALGSRRGFETELLGGAVATRDQPRDRAVIAAVDEVEQRVDLLLIRRPVDARGAGCRTRAHLAEKARARLDRRLQAPGARADPEGSREHGLRPLGAVAAGQRS